MKFKSKLAQAAYEEIVMEAVDTMAETKKAIFHAGLPRDKELVLISEGWDRALHARVRAIEVAAKIEIEEARNHAWSEPIQGTVEEKADCYHDWRQYGADDIRDGKNTCSKCGLVKYDYGRGPK